MATYKKPPQHIKVAKLTKVLRGFKNTQRILQASAHLLRVSEENVRFLNKWHYMWEVSRIHFLECSSGQAAFLKSQFCWHAVPQRFDKPATRNTYMFNAPKSYVKTILYNN